MQLIKLSSDEEKETAISLLYSIWFLTPWLMPSVNHLFNSVSLFQLDRLCTTFCNGQLLTVRAMAYFI